MEKWGLIGQLLLNSKTGSLQPIIGPTTIDAARWEEWKWEVFCLKFRPGNAPVPDRNRSDTRGSSDTLSPRAPRWIRNLHRLYKGRADSQFAPRVRPGRRGIHCST